MKKYLALLGLGFLAVCLLVPLVSGTYLVNYWSGTNQQVISSGGFEGWGYNAQGNNQYLVSFTIKVHYDGGALTGFAKGYLYEAPSLITHSIVTPVEVTSDVDLSSVGSTDSNVTFTFGGVQLLDSTKFYTFCFLLDGSLSGTLHLRTGSPGGNIGVWFDSDSHSNSGNVPDMVIVTADSPSGATPTPSVTPQGNGGDAAMEDLTNALLPILVPLLIVLIPAFLGLKFVGAWGFMAGLNVGVIIAYVILANTTYEFPLWGVVFLGIVDVLLVMKARG